MAEDGLGPDLTTYGLTTYGTDLTTYGAGLEPAGADLAPGLPAPSSVWDELVAAALLGTGRRPFPGTGIPGPLTDLLADKVGDPLAMASALWVYQEVGRTTAAGPSPILVAAPEDERDLLPATAVRSLETILTDRRFTPVLGEWLTLAARQGGRLPPELVPVALGSAAPTDRPATLAVAGPLANWLGELNPAWAWAAEATTVPAVPAPPSPVDGEKTDGHVLGVAWDGGDEARLAIFAALRVADPERARRLAEIVLGGEPTTTRAAIIRAMQARLSPDDEPFLESLLDDTDRRARRAASLLLAQLPTSRLAMRMQQRALPLVRVEGRLHPRLQVQPPTAPDPSAVRDGLDDDMSRGKRRSQAPSNAQQDTWLQEIIGCTPLTAWTKGLGRSPEELARLAHSARASALTVAWSEAAVRQRDPDWARGLLATCDPGTWTSELLRVLPDDQADMELVRLLGLFQLSDLVDVLLERPRPWSFSVSETVLRRLRATIASGEISGSLRVRRALPTFAVCLEPSLVSPADLAGALERPPEAKLAAARAFWERPIANLVAIAHFRSAMRQELS